MAKVQGYSEDEVDLLTTDFELVIEAAITRTAQRVADGLQPVIVADASSAGLSTSDIATVTAVWQDEIDGVLTPYIAEVYQGSATQVAVGLGNAFPDVDLPGVPLVADEFTLTYMKTVSNRLIGVGDELWEDIRNELLDGIAQGQSIAQIKDRIVAVSDFTHQRATAIARTEIHGAAESGSITQMRFVGYADNEVWKTWEATIGDDRTRRTHRAAHGQRVQLNEKFVVGSTHLDHPGEAGAPADEVIQCRCTQLFEVEEKPKFRCAGALIADATGASHCIVPVKKPDISHLSTVLPGMASSMAWTIFNTFMKHKITPAWGGAKIHKILALVRADLKANYPDIADAADDWQVLAAVDKFYAAKKDTFYDKYVVWHASPAGQKVIGTTPPPIKAVKTGIDVSSTTPPSPVIEPTPAFAPLPPIAPKPLPDDIQFTGKTLGSHGAQVWVNPSTGEKWLFKPQEDWMTDLDIKTAILQSKAGLTRPGVYKIKLNGQNGSIQYMFDNSTAAFPGAFDPLKLSDADLLVLQREQVFDWMISNFDAHTDQFIRTAEGTVAGVDKGQAFKFFGKDKLDWKYIAPGNFGTFVYPKIWKAFVDGRDIHLLDPTTGELGAYIDRLMAIPDDVYREMLTPYALTREKKFGANAAKFLDDAVKRKNNLKDDFAEFYARALAERSKHTSKPAPSIIPKPAPAPPPPPPAVPPPPVVAPVAVATPGSGIAGDISGIPFSTMQVIGKAWTAAGGGKKVTPGWGGAKIFKVLQELKIDPEVAKLGLSDLQLIRVLDYSLGFKGKPKTYESEVVDWLKSPGSAKVLLKMGLPGDSSLSPKLPAASPTAPTPVIAPKIVIPSEAENVVMTSPAHHVGAKGVLDNMSDYDVDDVVAYTKTSNGTYLKLTKTDWDEVSVHAQTMSGDWALVEPHAGPTQLDVLYPDEVWAMKPLITPPPSFVTKVPGLTPNMDITSDQVWSSKFLWNDGDVIAEAVEPPFSGLPDSGSMWQLVSHSNGDVSVHWQIGTGPLQTQDISSLADLQEVWKWSSAKWKTTGDIITAKKIESLVPSKNVGDVASGSELWDALGGIPTDKTFAYAFDAKSNIAYRLKKVPSPVGDTLVLEFRMSTSKTWQTAETIYDKKTLESISHGQTWHVAKLDGGMPDEVRAIIPNASIKSAPIPGPKPSIMPGKSVGDKVDPSEIWNAQYFASPNPGDIIATATSKHGTAYRIVYQTDDQLHIEYKMPAGVWVDSGEVPGPDDFITVNADGWKAADGSTTPMKATAVSTPTRTPTPVVAAKVAAKVASPPAPKITPKIMLQGNDTHFPKKDVGADVNVDEIFAVKDKYIDGQIIATSTAYGDHFRLFMVNGHLVQQKQNAAGAWGQTVVINSKNDMSFWGKWKAANDHTTAAQLKAAKKKVAPTPKAPVSVPTTPTLKAPTVSPVTVGPPITLSKEVDITPWDDTEQLEIFTFFKAKGIYVSSDSKTIWPAVQAVKSHFQAKYKGKYLDLNEAEILRIVDAAGAKKAGKVDTHPFETKIVNWLKSSAGKSWVNKTIDAPLATRDIPMPMIDIETSGVDPNTQSYAVISTTQAITYRTESHSKWGTWTAKQKAALKKYTGGIYSAWNNAIREGLLSTYREAILDAQAGFRPSTRSMLLHRGTSWAELNDPMIHSYESLLSYVGRTYVNRGFNSTSVGGSAAFHGQLLIEYEAPIGTPMAYLDDFSSNKGEREMLLPTHLIYQIISVTKRGTTTVMRVRVIGAATP